MPSQNVVIIVNDDTYYMNLFKTALDHERIETVVFTNPNLALEKIKINPNQFSVVLINYASQIKKSQRRFAKEVKAVNDRIKVVLTSGYDPSEEDILNGGYDRFLRLPVKLADLVSVVKEMLSS